MEENKFTRALYDQLSSKLDLGDYGQFDTMLSSDDKFRKAIFDQASTDLDLGDFPTFEGQVKKKVSPIESASKGETILQDFGLPSKEAITPPVQLESETPKPKDRETTVTGDVLRALKGGSLRALGGITGTPNFLARTISSFTIRPFIKAQGGTDEDARVVTDALLGTSGGGDIILGGAKAQEKLNKSAAKTEAKMMPIEGNIVQNLQSGEFGKAGELLLRGISQSVPYLAMTAATAGAGTPAVLTTIGATSASQQYAETEGKPEGKRILNGWLYGGFEAAGELVTAGIVNGIGKAYKQGVIKEVNEKFIQGAAKQVAKDFGLEGSSEAATQIGQNLTDIITGVDPNRKIFDNVLDATLIGGVSGGGLGAAHVAASALGRAIASPKEVQQVQDNVQQQQVLIDQIESTESPAVQTALKDRLKTLQEEANQVMEQNTQIVDNFTPEEKVKAGELFTVANDLQSKIDNNEVDEQEAPVIEKTIEGINEQIETLKETVLTRIEEANPTANMGGIEVSEEVAQEKQAEAVKEEVVAPTEEEVVPIEQFKLGNKTFGSEQELTDWLDQNYNEQDRFASVNEEGYPEGNTMKVFNEWYDKNKKRLAKEEGERLLAAEAVAPQEQIPTKPIEEETAQSKDTTTPLVSDKEVESLPLAGEAFNIEEFPNRKNPRVLISSDKGSIMVDIENGIMKINTIIKGGGQNVAPEKFKQAPKGYGLTLFKEAIREAQRRGITTIESADGQITRGASTIYDRLKEEGYDVVETDGITRDEEGTQVIGKNKQIDYTKPVFTINLKSPPKSKTEQLKSKEETLKGETKQKPKLGAMDDPTWKQNATTLYKQYEDAVDAYRKNEDDEAVGQAMEDAGKAWRDFKDAQRAAYSAGNISEAELGNMSSLGSKIITGDLKDVGGQDVYHFTVAADKVSSEGLLTKDEVVRGGGKEAIGGGSGISLTTDKGYAETLLGVFKEMQEALRGKVNIAKEFIELEKTNPNEAESIIRAIKDYLGGTDADVRDAIINNRITYNRNRVKGYKEMKEGESYPKIVSEPISKYDFVKQYFNALTMFSPKREWVALFNSIEGLENAELGIFKGKTKANAKGELYPAEREIRVHSGDAIENLKRIDSPSKPTPKSKPTKGELLKQKEAKLKDEIAKDLEDLVFLLGGVQKITGAERGDIVDTLVRLIHKLGDLTLLKGEQLLNRVKEELQKKGANIPTDVLDEAIQKAGVEMPVEATESVTEAEKVQEGDNVPPKVEKPKKAQKQGKDEKFRKTQINSLIQDETLQQQEVAKIVDANKEKYTVLHGADAIAQAKAIIDAKGVQGATLEMSEPSKGLADYPINQVARQILLDFYSRAIIDSNATEADKNLAFRNIDALQQITAREATKAGQGNALLQIWKSMQPAGLLEFVKRKIEKGNEKILKQKLGDSTIGQQIDELYNTLTEESKKIIDDILAGKAISVAKAGVKEPKAPPLKKFVPKERVKQEQDYRKSLIEQYKKSQSGTMALSIAGLTPAQIELGGNLIGSYIREGYYRAQDIIDKLAKDFKGIGTDLTPEQTDELLEQTKDGKKTYREHLTDIEAQTGVKKEIGKQINDIVKKHWSEKDELKRTLAQKLVDEAGLSEADAKKLEKAVLDEFDKVIKEKAQGQLTKILGTEKIPVEKAPKGVMGKMIDLINMGALDEDLYRDLFSEKFKLVKLTDAHKTEILKLADNVQQSSGKGWLERDATIRLGKYIFELYPQTRSSEIIDTWIALSYSNMLSGPFTTILNLWSAGSNMVFRPIRDVVNFSKWLRMFKRATKGDFDVYNPIGDMGYLTMLRGVGIGWNDAKEVYVNGDLNNKYVEDVAKKNQFKVTPLERDKFGKSKRFKPIPIKIGGRTFDLNIFNAYKYAGRNLAAQDKLMLTSAYEVEIAHILRDKLKNKKLSGRALTKEVMAILRGDRVDMNLVDQTLAEDVTLYKKLTGKEMSPLQQKIRKRELILEQLPITKEEKAEAEQLARSNIFTDDRGGAFATVAQGIGRLSNSSSAGALILKPFVPFTKVVGNVSEYMMDAVPYYGFLRANGLGVVSLIKKRIDPDMLTAQMGAKGSRLYYEQMGRAWMGTIAFHLLLMTLLGNDDEDDIEISGGYTKEGFKKPGRANVLPPYTLRIKNVEIPYKNIPSLAIPFALIGNLNDGLRDRREEGDLTDRMTAALLLDAVGSSVIMQKDMSFLSGVQSATQMMADISSGDEKKYEKVGEQMIKSYLGFATRPLPQNNNAVQQIWKIFDPNAHSQADIKEMLGYAGGVQHFVNKESLDQFGEVVKSYPGETLLPYTHWLNLKGGDKRWEMLAKYNAIPQKIYNRTMQIETQDGIEKRQLEPEEMHDYVSRTGKLFSDAVKSYMANEENVVKRGAEVIEREKANGDLEKVSGVREDVEKMWAKARDHAETELFRWGTVKEDMPKAWEVIKANEAYQYYQVSKTTKGYKWNDSELYMLNNLASKYYAEEVVPYLQDTKLTKEDKADIDEETGKSYYEKELARIWKDALSLAEGDMMDLIEAKVENLNK